MKIREIVKYENYKRFGANVKITYDGKDLQKGSEAKGTDPNAKPQPPQK